MENFLREFVAEEKRDMARMHLRKLFDTVFIKQLETATKISCPKDVINGCLFTKEKRQELYGRVSGGSGSTKPEKYQRAQIEIGTGQKCSPTKMRINWRTNELVEQAQPMKNVDGFDYTENFDGKQVFGEEGIVVWVNLKSVVGKGGSQTRTLRDECYKFIHYQLEYMLKQGGCKKVHFANIFDGDEASSKIKMFKYMIDLPAYADVKNYIYVGDLKSYFDWVQIRLSMIV